MHNPKFYENERLRLSNHATPRLIRCYVEELDLLRLPRGLTEAARAIIEEAGSRFDFDDQRTTAATIDYTFDTVLFPVQQAAADALNGMSTRCWSRRLARVRPSSRVP